jgi:sugar/nucleoside kinase (ribokinase family)
VSPNGSPRGGDAPQLVVVGAASRDLDRDDRRGWRLGGAVSYGSLLAARLGVRVGVLMGLDPAARGAHELELLREAGADVVRVPLGHGPVFDNIETEHGRRQVSHGWSDPVPVDALPPRWRDAAAFLFAPIAGELGPEWAAVPSADSVVALSYQGLLRELPADDWVVQLPARPDELLARADLVGVSRDDLRAGGGDLGELLPRAGQELAITNGEQGALHLTRRTDGSFAALRVPAVETDAELDPVGAGDAFLTTWLVSRMPGGGPFGRAPLPTPKALRLAATVSTLTVEGVGLAGLPTAAALARRLIATSGNPARR